MIPTKTYAALPITALGKFFAVISAFSSIGVVALPAGILAGSFSERFKKK